MVTVRSHLCILPLRLPAPRGSRICPIGDRTIRYTATAAIACYVGHRCDRRSCGAFRCVTPRAHAAARPPMQTRELRRVRTCASPESVPPNHGNVPSILSPSIRAFDDASWSDPEDTSSLLEDSSKLEDFTLVSSGSLQDQGKVPLRFSAAVPVGVGYFAAHHRSPGFRAYSVISPPSSASVLFSGMPLRFCGLHNGFQFSCAGDQHTPGAQRGPLRTSVSAAIDC